MKKIYIVTTYTGTSMSYLIKKAIKEDYAHVSISLDNNFDNMYSFGRKVIYTPFIGGLIKEDINKGLYKIKPKTMCRVYSIEVDKAKYDLVQSNLDTYWEERDNYKYDFRGTIYMILNRSRWKNNYYVCSTFVADVLDKSNINLFDKPFYTITPKEFLRCNDLKLEYEGLLKSSNKYLRA